MSLKSLLDSIRALFLFLFLWSVYLNGCGTWKMVKPPPETSPASVHVTTLDSTRFELKDAFARQDTLFGTIYERPLDYSLIMGEASPAEFESLLAEAVCDSTKLDSTLARLTPEGLCDSTVTIDRFRRAIQKTAKEDTSLSREEIEEINAIASFMKILEAHMGKGGNDDTTKMGIPYSRTVAIPLSNVEKIEQRTAISKVAETTGYVILMIGVLALAVWSESLRAEEQ